MLQGRRLQRSEPPQLATVPLAAEVLFRKQKQYRHPVIDG